MTEQKSVLDGFDNPSDQESPTYLSGLDAVPGSGFLDDLPKPTMHEDGSIDIKARRKRIVRMAQDDPEAFNFLVQEFEDAMHFAFEVLRTAESDDSRLGILHARVKEAEKSYNLISALGERQQ